ncbi:aminoglycoside N(3)-acetyltransferase [Thalassobacillus sp. CUG 92003]|uniref:aminoglycoside N(3)-acetyltransferase n=1 Tax=Thalassobacillus sp. CUG 92003 TaxID=2736641 RepID=UPI0015E6BD36|nr:AAC(3) family N-acetyltransferase [Thalassobacillus sp. CUG 92003]
MNEQSIIENTPKLRTRASLAEDLKQLGLEPGMTVIVHASLRSIGWISGGAIAVVQALMDVVTEKGTIVMPTHTFPISDPINMGNPPLPQAWHEEIRETMPAYDPQITPTAGMGAIVETFRTFPFVVRSSHPIYSMAAWGKDAKKVTANQPLDYGMGEGSPLARVYEENGKVLFIGTGYSTNTSFHLGETRSGVRNKVRNGAPIIENNQRVWKTFEEADLDSDCFEQMGTEFEQQIPVKRGKVGSASSVLLSQPEAVNFAENWLLQHVK